MKKIFTLAAVGALTAASLGAQAQITVDGQLTAAEVSATGYTLVGRRPGLSPSTRGFGDAGILAVYAAADANNLYFFVVGTLQTSTDAATTGNLQNSIQLFIDRPGVAGIPVGTALPLPASATAPAVNTSFQNMGARLDLAADIAVAVSRNDVAGQLKVDAIVYTPGTPNTASAIVASGTTPLNVITGAALNTPATLASPFQGFANASIAYRTSTNLSSNPGYNAGNATTIGNAPGNGLEIRVSRSAMGIPATGGQMQIFAVQNNQDGGFLSSDYIPQGGVASSNANPGASPDFTSSAYPGTQAATLQIGTANLTVLSNKAAEAAVALSVYPNPTQDVASVAYRVQSGSQDVRVELVDLMGRTVKVLREATEAAGNKNLTFSKSDLATGTYMVRVQVGDQAVTRRVVLL
jgi:Secretion system C-terminal sorting domain